MADRAPSLLHPDAGAERAEAAIALTPARLRGALPRSRIRAVAAPGDPDRRPGRFGSIGGALCPPVCSVRRDDADHADGLMLFSLLGHGSFIAVLVPVFGWLAITGSLSTTVLIAAVALVVAVLVVSGVGLTTLQRGSIPLWAQRRLPHRVTGFIDEALATGVPARGLAAPFAIAISVDLLGIAMLWTALRSLGAPSSLEIAAGGYVIGTLFLMIAPLFQGIGI